MRIKYACFEPIKCSHTQRLLGGWIQINMCMKPIYTERVRRTVQCVEKKINKTKMAAHVKISRMKYNVIIRKCGFDNFLFFFWLFRCHYFFLNCSPSNESHFSWNLHKIYNNFLILYLHITGYYWWHFGSQWSQLLTELSKTKIMSFSLVIF